MIPQIKKVLETKKGLKYVVVPKRCELKSGDYVMLKKVEMEDPKIS